MYGHLKPGVGSLAWFPSIYVLLTLLIGWMSRTRAATSGDYLNATRSLPLWIVTAAYLGSNCGALEIVGLSAMAAQYGAEAFDFYWIGAIPAMIFLALVMMPVYRRSGVRSVPEYLLLRYGSRIRLLNAATTAIILLLLAGVSLYAMGQVLEVVTGLRFIEGVLCSASVVLAYVLMGGLRATIYNEVLQLAVMLVGLVPLAIRSRHLAYALKGSSNGAVAHLWVGLPLFRPHASMDAAGIVFGLGFVLSFGYWCTDFVLMQRAFTARTPLAARQVPLWAGFGKLLFAPIVVLPGLAAYLLLPRLGTGLRYDHALPMMMQRAYGPAMLQIGLTALAASLMSGLAANVTAFASIWTEDIYRVYFQRQRSEMHYIHVGRVALIVAMLAGLAASYLNFMFKDLMEHVQLIFSVFGSPFWAIFLLGMASKKVDESGALFGFLSGAGISFVHSVAVRCGLLHYGSTMTADFYGAGLAFLTASAVAWAASGKSRQQTIQSLGFRWEDLNPLNMHPLLWVLAVLLMASCAVFNFMWR